MSEACPKCPCPDICLRREIWCRWAAEKPSDSVEAKSICDRSRLAKDPASYPSLARQAANLAGSIGQVVAAAVRGQSIRVTPEVLEHRRTLCLGCEFNGLRANGGIRCAKCGCGAIKLHISTERCPIGKWEKVESA
jgi:hypothetical protein